VVAHAFVLPQRFDAPLYGAAGDQIAAPALEEVKGSIGAEINKYDDVAVTENDGEEISNKARVLRLQSCQGFES
jgi:hypothetical protein